MVAAAAVVKEGNYYSRARLFERPLPPRPLRHSLVHLRYNRLQNKGTGSRHSETPK